MTKDEIQKMTIKEIKEYPDKDDSFISFLLGDSRVGVRKLGHSLLRKKEKERLIYENTLKKKELELKLFDQGFRFICGMDEVGRGPLAGPVVTAAVLLPYDSFILGIDDSKQLKEKQRNELSEAIKKEAVSYSYGVVSPEHIDEINILQATKLAMLASVKRLTQEPDVLLIDALHLETPIHQVSLVHGDSLSYSIGAASILAKVKRDAYMRKQAELYPEYGFERNVGYGTAEHIEAIKKYGLTPIHRKTFCKKFIYDKNSV